METDRKGSGLATVFAIIAVLAVVFFGWSLYRSMTNTPERAIRGFVQSIAASDTKKVNNYLSPSFKSDGQAVLQRYEAMLKNYKGAPELTSKELIANRFNTYSKNSNPVRITYKLTVNGTDHHLIFLAYKSGHTWYIDDISGN